MYQTELRNFSIEEIADSGQCFRIAPDAESYIVIAFGRVLRVSHEGTLYTFSCDEEEFKDIWYGYFDLGTDYDYLKKVALKDDDFLRAALMYGGGIRILNQEPWETLISFIISQRKSIPAIRTSIERLCLYFGRDLEGGYHSFPTPEALFNADGEILAKCGLGYRLPYVREAARSVLTGETDFDELSKLDTRDLINKLMRLRGVGIKVATCVALFAFHRVEAFPIDVWMKRVIELKYGGHLPDEYRPYAGALQQYLFSYARAMRVGAK